MSEYLPQELLIEILSRLPAKSLIKFRCVSKTWNSLITSPSFIARHLNRTSIKNKNKNSNLLLFGYSREGDARFWLYPDDGFPDYPVEVLDCSLKYTNYHVNIVGSCNGVVCLVGAGDPYTGFDDPDDYFRTAALWNPCIRKTVLIPRPNVTLKSHSPAMHSLGFGFDSVSNDYKLVRVVYLADDNGWLDNVPLVEVYSLRSKCWRMVHNDQKFFIPEHSLSAAVNGACHWIAQAPMTGGSARFVIVSFALDGEVFGEIIMPDCLTSTDHTGRISVAVLDESLLIVPYNEFSLMGRQFSIWIMNEYGVAESWMKLFNITNLEGLQRVVAFRNNGKILLVDQGGELVLYDPKTEEVSRANIQGDVRSFYMDTYVESLLLLS